MRKIGAEYSKTSMESDDNEWELSKENVQPLKHGRKFSSLSAALHPVTDGGMTLTKSQKQDFESELRTYNGDDPLDVWYRYILWTEQAYPKGGKDSSLALLLERCLHKFSTEERYKNDHRLISSWIKYADLCKEPLEIYNFMQDQGIGVHLAIFYEAWAWLLEQLGNTRRADAVFKEGKKNLAQPLDLLERKHEDFQKRVMRGTMSAMGEATEEPIEEERAVLGSLRSTGKRGKVPNSRIGHSKIGSQGGLGLKPGAGSQVGGGFQVFSDENQAPSLHGSKGEWTETPKDGALNKENDKKAGVWTKAKIGQKHLSVPINEVNNYVKPSFTVHVEENAEQQLMTPRKPKELNNQVLSARKPEKHVDPLQTLRQAAAASGDAIVVPGYCREKVYCGTQEYSFEEIRAAKWFKKQQKEEERKVIEESKKEMENQRRELERMRQLLSEESLRIRQEQEQLRLQHQQIMMDCKQQFGAIHTQYSNERQLQVQHVQDQVEQDIQKRMAEQLNLSNSEEPRPKRRDTGARNQLVFEDRSQLNRESPELDQETDTFRPLGAMNASSHTPSGEISANINISGNSFSGGRKSLAAPSPTVNTKEAMQVIRGMFNASLEIEKNIGKDSSMIKDPGQQNSEGMPFTIFNENSSHSIKPKAIKPSMPFAIYDENACEGKPSGNLFPIYDETKHKAPTVPDIPRTSGFTCYRDNMDKTKDRTGFAIFQDDSLSNDERSMAVPEMPSAPTRIGAMSMPGVRDGPRMPQPTDLCNLTELAGNMENINMMEYDDKLQEGIESEAKDDYTIAAVGSHLSFAAAARFASTPFQISKNPNPDISDIQDNQMSSDSERKEFSNVSVRNKSNATRSTLHDSKEDLQNLSPIMEGSNEEFSDNQPHSRYGDPSMRSKSQSDSHHMTHSNKQEDLHDLSAHLIDTSGYISPDKDEQTENLMSMSIRIDPSNPFDEATIQGFLKHLSKPLSSYDNYVEMHKPFMSFNSSSILYWGDLNYNILGLIGKGGYASVYKASLFDIFDCLENENGGNTECCNFYALKVQKPANPWEFYICCEIQERLSSLADPVDVRPAMMNVEHGYFFDDASCLATKYCQHGTLLNLVNQNLKISKQPFCESIALYLTIELLHIVEKLHKCQIIHGDIKPDNFLILDVPDYEDIDAQHVFETTRRPLRLIDFGQSIDMSKYPPDTTFMAKVSTKDFQCIEMKTDRPWTYQTDLFGLAGTIHVLVFGQYMKVFKTRDEWKMSSSFNRSWNVDLWKSLFRNLLNVPSCDRLPNLTNIRKDMENYFKQSLPVDFKEKWTKLAINVCNLAS